MKTLPEARTSAAEVARHNATVRTADRALTTAIAAAFGLGTPHGPMTHSSDTDRSVPWLLAHLPSLAHYEALLDAAGT